MFTGIIEAIGIVEAVEKKDSNLIFSISSSISSLLSVDESVSHNGVCLTVIDKDDNHHRVEAITETLQKSNLSSLQKGDAVNLERAMLLNSRLDGHLVQGHVDATALCIRLWELNGSHHFRFQFPEQFSHLVIEKGSICLNGISLTIFDVTQNEFTVAIIPYTFEHTNMKQMQAGKQVNVEFDLIGKYIERMIKANAY